MPPGEGEVRTKRKSTEGEFPDTVPNWSLTPKWGSWIPVQNVPLGQPCWEVGEIGTTSHQSLAESC